MTQLQFHSPIWGTVDFFPVKGKAVRTKCKHCILCRTEADCRAAPCDATERDDGQSGYYSIHQMPNRKSSIIKS